MSRILKRNDQEYELVRAAGGGLNERSDVYDVPDGECTQLVNFDFIPGAWRKRKGTVKKIQLPSTGSIDTIIIPSFLNENVMLAIKGGIIYSIDYTEEEWSYTALTSDVTLTSGYRFDWAQFEDTLFLTNGADRMLKWRGGSENVERVGVAAATDGSAAFGSSGLCTIGNHGVRICWRNNDAGTISQYKDFGAITSSGSDKLTISSLTDSTDDQVTHLEIYMTIAGDDGGTYYLAAQVAIGGTYEASISDASLVAAATMDAVADQGIAAIPAEKIKYIASMKKRVFGANIYRDGAWRKDEITWSEVVGSQIAEAEYFNNYRRINTNGGEIMRVVPWGDYLYILHEKGVCVLTDPANPEYSIVQELPQTVGCTAPWSVAVGKFKRPVATPRGYDKEEFEIAEGIVYKGRWGIVAFDGVRDHPLSEKISDTIDSMAPSVEDGIVGQFWDGKYYLSYGARRGAAGEEVTATEETTTSGGERIDATFSADREFTSADAVNYLAQVSKADTEITVSVRVPFNEEQAKLGYSAEFTVNIDINVSMDNGSTWSRVATKVLNNDGAVLNVNPAQENYEFTFVKQGVNAVSIGYIGQSSDAVDGEQVSYVQLRAVKYVYDPSATIVNTEIVYYDSLLNQWAKYTALHAASFAALWKSSDNTNIYFGHSSNGAIYLMNSGYSDDGEDIFALVTTGYTSAKHDERHKRWIRNSIIVNFANDPIYYIAYVDKLEKMNKVLDRAVDGGREQFYDESDYGESYYSLHEGEKQVGSNLDPNYGYRMAEEIWVSGQDALIIRGRVSRFLFRE